MNNPISESHARRVGEWRNIRYVSWPTRRDYSFTFTLVDNGWRIYINNSPNYRNRPSGAHESHRLSIGTRPYICWDQPLVTISEAQGVAALWADSTENYIATGRFEPAAGRPRVQDRTALNGYAAGPGPQPVAEPPAPSRPPRKSLWERFKDLLFNLFNY